MDKDYHALKAAWSAGIREREAGLHLLFMAWMHWADPMAYEHRDDGAQDLWRGIYAHFGGQSSNDAEFLCVAGLMAELFPWGFGDEQAWQARGQRLSARARTLRPEGFASDVFAGRGAYGEYFAHQAAGARNGALPHPP